MSEPPGSRAECVVCPIGAAAAVGRGGRCPMVDRRHAAGARIYSAGESVQSVWYVKSGAVALTRGIDDGEGYGKLHALRRSGSLLGVEGLVRDKHLDSAKAITEATLCGAPREEMIRWVEDATAARAVLACVLRDHCNDEPRRATADGTASERLARWLLDTETTKQGRSLPRSAIAGLLGMKPETLSRALASLAKKGAIAVGRMRISIVQRNVLRALATGEEDPERGPDPNDGRDAPNRVQRVPKRG